MPQSLVYRRSNAPLLIFGARRLSDRSIGEERQFGTGPFDVRRGNMMEKAVRRWLHRRFLKKVIKRVASEPELTQIPHEQA